MIDADDSITDFDTLASQVPELQMQSNRQQMMLLQSQKQQQVANLEVR